MSRDAIKRMTAGGDRQAWREAREARRIVLAKVRARRRLIQARLARRLAEEGGDTTDAETA